MATTDNQTYDNVGNPDAIIAPAACQVLTLRQSPADATLLEYVLRAPDSTSAPFHKYPGEGTEFRKYPLGNLIQKGEIVGYLETIGSTGDFELIAE
jgi:hypothetical protein